MEKELLEKLLNEGLSTTQISTLINKSTTTVKYWVKKYQLKFNFQSFAQQGKKDFNGNRYCPNCKENCDISLFYFYEKSSLYSAYCKPCGRKLDNKRQNLIKTKCIEYKGGKCILCGYNKCNSAMEFHHIDPNCKDFEISKVRTSKFGEKITKELDKCVLLCANCHREVESGLVTIL